MTSSGTYTFNPTIGEAGLYALRRCGVHRAAITQEHMTDLRMAANLVLADWSNKGVNLWKVELVNLPFVAGTATYSVDPSVVVILDGYVTVTTGTANTDRLITPVSRSEYASYANKQEQGYPTSYWHDRLLSPTITFWLVPDGTTTAFNYYAVQRIQDAGFTNGQTADIPYLWMKAWTDALSEELAYIYAPDRLLPLAQAAAKSYMAAADQNVEVSNFYVSPGVQSYWRP